MTFEELAEKLDRFTVKRFGHGAKEGDIHEAAARLGVRLSGGYRQFLRRFGWGGVEDIELFGLGADVPSFLHLVAMTESERSEMSPALPVHLIPVMNDGGGNLYCLDARVPDEPPVVFWDHTAGEDQQPQQVAPDFVSWLSEELGRFEQET
jgi:hypothetical protein